MNTTMLATLIVGSGLIGNLISLCIVALVLYLIFWLVSKFMGGVPAQIVGVVLGLILLLYAIQLFGFSP